VVCAAPSWSRLPLGSSRPLGFALNAATFVVLALLLVGHLRTVDDRLWDTANTLFEARLDD